MLNIFFLFFFVGSHLGSDSGNDMVIQEDTIFVSGMSAQTSEDDIANHFGAIGIIKVSFVKLILEYY